MNRCYGYVCNAFSVCDATLLTGMAVFDQAYVHKQLEGNMVWFPSCWLQQSSKKVSHGKACLHHCPSPFIHFAVQTQYNVREPLNCDECVTNVDDIHEVLPALKDTMFE